MKKCIKLARRRDKQLANRDAKRVSVMSGREWEKYLKEEIDGKMSKKENADLLKASEELSCLHHSLLDEIEVEIDTRSLDKIWNQFLPIEKRNCIEYYPLFNEFEKEMDVENLDKAWDTLSLIEKQKCINKYRSIGLQPAL